VSPRRTVNSAGLIGARVTIAGALKASGHVAMTARAIRAGRSRWWLAAGLGSLAVDALLTKKLSQPEYRPGVPHYAAEVVDAALWGVGAGPRPNATDDVLVADALPSALVDGWRFASGTKAIPVYDERSAYPYLGTDEALPAIARLLVPVVLPYTATVLARRAAGLRTHWANLCWGAIGATVGVVVARQRDALQAHTTATWMERAQRQVEHERVTSRFALMTTSSPGHDFKKTLFALGLAGSDEAMAAALEQGARPAQARREMNDRLLAEAAHRIAIEPPDQAMRPLTEPHVRALQQFLLEAAERAPDGGDQSIMVEDIGGYALRLTYLGSELILRNDPPPLAARLNPTAVTIGVGAMLKTTDTLLAFGGSQTRWIMGPLTALDVYGMARYWRRPPNGENLSGVFRLAFAGGCMGIAAASGPWTRLTNREGAAAYPALHALRDLLLVLLPNWDMATPRQKQAVPALAAAALAATLIRRRHSGFDWLDFLIECSIVTNAIAVFRVASRVEDEASMLEERMFDWYAGQIVEARQLGEREELAVYRAQLEIARRALKQLPGLDPDDRASLQIDCDLLQEWLDKVWSRTDQRA
jgi:hypothetical protein